MNELVTSYLLLQGSHNHSTLLPVQSNLSLTSSLYSHFICCHLTRPLTSSSLKITNRSFWHASPHIWNKLPVLLRQLSALC